MLEDYCLCYIHTRTKKSNMLPVYYIYSEFIWNFRFTLLHYNLNNILSSMENLLYILRILVFLLGYMFSVDSSELI